MVTIHQNENEFMELLKLYRWLDPKCVLEIGSAKGGSLKYLIVNAPTAETFISIDLDTDKLAFLYQYTKEGQDLNLIRGDSHLPSTALKVAERLKGRNLDFLFIDGDHSYQGVKSDFTMYSAYVKNGLIAFHDIVKHPPEYNCHVDIYWQEIKDHYPSLEIIEDKKQGWAGIGVIGRGSATVSEMV